jgi:predicted enzyme related to lactoylglutathione lyase
VESLPGLGQSLVGRFVGASLRVIDIDATYRDLLAKGVAFVEPPERMPRGGVLAHFKDPDGNILTLLGD